MSVSKSQILKLYRNMLREANKFPAYNFRTYALRRIKDGFHMSKNLSDSAEIRKQFDNGVKNLEILKRQTLISKMFDTNLHVMELKKNQKRQSRKNKNK